MTHVIRSTVILEATNVQPHDFQLSHNPQPTSVFYSSQLTLDFLKTTAQPNRTGARPRLIIVEILCVTLHLRLVCDIFSYDDLCKGQYYSIT